MELDCVTLAAVPVFLQVYPPLVEKLVVLFSWNWKSSVLLVMAGSLPVPEPTGPTGLSSESPPQATLNITARMTAKHGSSRLML
jgi:hypothetical protein